MHWTELNYKNVLFLSLEVCPIYPLFFHIRVGRSRLAFLPHSMSVSQWVLCRLALVFIQSKVSVPLSRPMSGQAWQGLGEEGGPQGLPIDSQPTPSWNLIASLRTEWVSQMTYSITKKEFKKKLKKKSPQKTKLIFIIHSSRVTHEAVQSRSWWERSLWTEVTLWDCTGSTVVRAICSRRPCQGLPLACHISVQWSMLPLLIHTETTNRAPYVSGLDYCTSYGWSFVKCEIMALLGQFKKLMLLLWVCD